MSKTLRDLKNEIAAIEAKHGDSALNTELVFLHENRDDGYFTENVQRDILVPGDDVGYPGQILIDTLHYYPPSSTEELKTRLVGG